jgi:hypothetical protein
MMNPFEHGLGNPQRNITSLVAGVVFSNHKHARFILKELANLISAQAPHLSDFRNGIVPLDVY